MNGLVQDWPTGKWLFQVKYFSFKSAWILHVRCNLAVHQYFLAEMLLLCMLQYFVLVFLRNKVQTSQKNYRGVLLLNWKAHEKFGHFWRKKIQVRKSLRSVLHQAIRLMSCWTVPERMEEYESKLNWVLSLKVSMTTLWLAPFCWKNSGNHAYHKAKVDGWAGRKT